MSNMQFVMGTDLTTALPKTIDFNYEQLKSELEQRLEHYNALVVTEGDLKGAKADRANLNKLREALEDERKRVKRECMAPYTAFETQVKDLVGLIDKPIAVIDGQLKSFDDSRKMAKRAEIETFFGDAVGDLFDILSLSAIWKDEWLNTGVTMKKIKEEIGGQLERVRNDLTVIATVESEFAEAVKLKYLDTLDVTAALAERARLQEQARRLREYEELKKVKVAPPVEPEEKEPVTFPGIDRTVKPEPVSETVYRLTFECTLTKQQAKDLDTYLKMNNIQYRRV